MTAYNKIGFLAAGVGNARGIGDYVKRLDAAGIPAVCMCNDGTVGVMDAIELIKKGSKVPHVLAYRVVRPDQSVGVEHYSVPDYASAPADAAQKHWSMVRPKFPPELIEFKEHVWFFPVNEIRAVRNPGDIQYKDMNAWDWMGEFCYELAQLSMKEKIKVAMPQANSGEPVREDWKQPGMVKYLQLCAEQPDLCAIGLHEYTWNVNLMSETYPHQIGRFEWLFETCDELRINRPNVLIGEWGWEKGNVPGPTEAIRHIHWAAQLYAKYPSILGAGTWYLGRYQDRIDDKTQRLIEPVTNYTLSEEAKFPDPPPDPRHEKRVITPTELTEPTEPTPDVEDVEEPVDEKPAITPKKDKPPEKPNHRGIELDFFKVLDGRSDFRIHKLVWCEFRYNNTLGHEIPYGGIGIAVHKWTGSDWIFGYYQHSYKGKLRAGGGPTPDGSSHEDRWKNVDVGVYALTPFLTFDELAQNKRKNPTAISEGFFMGPPVYIKIGSNIEPGGRIDKPPAPLFPEPEPEEVIDPGEPVQPKPSVSKKEVSKPAGSLGEFLWNEGEAKRLMRLNPAAALQKVILNDGFLPVSEEFSATFEDQPYVAQSAEHLGSGAKRVYYAAVGKWDDVRFVASTKGADTTAVETPVVFDIETEESEVELVEVKPAGFHFQFWPTDTKKVNQYFGANPEIYKKFGLPGHEGIDLRSLMGTPYFAVAPGTVTRVTDKRANGTESAYGWHVVVDHGGGYSTLYAHAKPNPPVGVGQRVEGGQIVAHSGNTGNSSGPHLHLTLKKAGHQIPGWPAGYMDPWPFLEPLYNELEAPTGDLVEGYLWLRSLELRGNKMAVTKLGLNMREKADKNSVLLGKTQQGATVRILREEPENGYLLCEASISKVPKAAAKVIPTGKRVDMLEYVRGDGRLYEVKSARGQERFQTQQNGSTFYLTKNRNWEEFFYDNDFIYRDVDTSPGAGRYYRVKDADLAKGSRWLRRRMAEGETYTQSRQVQFYMKDSGAKSAANSGNVTDTIKFVKHHNKYKFQTDIEIEDVVELLWVNGGETYFYAKKYGMVGWRREHDDPNSPPWSAISEEHGPGQRPDNEREPVRIV